MSEKYNDYLQLRNDIDYVCKKLWSIHKTNMICREGCDNCCMDFGLLAVEYHNIKDSLKIEDTPVNLDYSEGECPFLVNSSCSIYEHRPIICRTHGYPLLQMGENDWDLSACELNFTKVSEDYFKDENCYPQDLYNSKLYLVNINYLESEKGSSSGPALYPLSDLLKS